MVNKNQVVFNQWSDCLTRKASRIVVIFMILGVMFSCTIVDLRDGLRAPTSFAPSFISTNEVTLSWGWNVDNDVTKYYYILSNQTASENLGTIAASSEKKEHRYTVTNLKPNTDYTFYLKACGDWGCSTYSNAKVSVTTRPNLPEKFAFVKEKTTSASLSFTWEPPTDGAHHYALYRSDGVALENIMDTEQVASGLDPGISYTFDLVACNKKNLCSATNDLTVTTPPSKVTDLKVSDTKSTSVTISWTKPKGTTSYVISNQEDGGTTEKVANDLNGDDTEFTITNLTPRIPYTFSLQACTDAGCSEVATASTTTSPEAPKNFSSKAVTPTTVPLEWDAVTGAESYIVYQGTIPIATNVGTPPATPATSYLVTDLDYDRSYTFTVKACISNRCSDPSKSHGTITPEPRDFFKIRYSKMDSGASTTSVPAITSGKNCDLQGFHNQNKVVYGIGRTGTGGTGLVLPTIGTTTGMVDNTGASAGVYAVTVRVDGNADCNTNVLVYNAVTPANKAQLINDITAGIGLHGNDGNFNYIITEQITDMSVVFHDKNNFNGDISEWDTSKVENMRLMFNNAYAFNQPIGEWETSNVVSMYGMFNNTRNFNQPIGDWETSKVTLMKEMFNGATNFNQDISGWNTENVTTMEGMFNGASVFNQDLSGWDVTSVTLTGRGNVFTGSAMENVPNHHPTWTP